VKESKEGLSPCVKSLPYSTGGPKIEVLSMMVADLGLTDLMYTTEREQLSQLRNGDSVIYSTNSCVLCIL
jgi:hypothetical protein